MARLTCWQVVFHVRLSVLPENNWVQTMNETYFLKCFD